MSTRLSDYDYELPDSLIAQAPFEPRDKCRLLVLDRASGSLSHAIFDQIGNWLRADDLLILNDTKVLRARHSGFDANGRKFEVLLLSPIQGAMTWECMVRPAKKIAKAGNQLKFPGGVTGTFTRTDDYLWTVTLSDIDPSEVFSWIESNGQLPLPPYIQRQADAEDDRKYQTVFAGTEGSVAAPTAGLHFTQDLLDSLRAAGTAIETITLHVGYGTFSPIRADDLSDHRMHAETYEVRPEVWEAIRKTKERGGRVIACGTTVARTLESVGGAGLTGSTDIFIHPGHEFQVVDALITNFHLPKSSLLVLVSAFAGRQKMLETYREAIAREYRFFSYGDAMLLL